MNEHFQEELHVDKQAIKTKIQSNILSLQKYNYLEHHIEFY